MSGISRKEEADLLHGREEMVTLEGGWRTGSQQMARLCKALQSGDRDGVPASGELLSHSAEHRDPPYQGSICVCSFLPVSCSFCLDCAGMASTIRQLGMCSTCSPQGQITQSVF